MVYRKFVFGKAHSTVSMILGLLAVVVGTDAAGASVPHPESDRAQAIAARLRPALQSELSARHLLFGAPAYVRIFKRESELELWLRGANGKYSLFRTYSICRFSGALGPKQKEGDNQAPEGFYSVSRKQLNPRSQFHLAFNLGYPNEYDRAQGRSGSALMVHGNCVSIGCYAMGDAAIEEIYTLVDAALANGQGEFAVHIFPMRMTPGALAAAADSPWRDFWHELQPAYTLFEHQHVPPTIDIRQGRYHVSP